MVSFSIKPSYINAGAYKAKINPARHAVVLLLVSLSHIYTIKRIDKE